MTTTPSTESLIVFQKWPGGCHRFLNFWCDEGQITDNHNQYITVYIIYSKGALLFKGNSHIFIQQLITVL